MRPLLAVILMTGVAGATPPDGDYSNMTAGDIVQVDPEVPFCMTAEKLGSDDAVNEARDRLRGVFKTTHARVSAKTLEVAGIDTRAPGTPTVDVTRAESYVSGWLDLKKERNGGALWQFVGVKDPDGSLHEQLEVGYVVRDANGEAICGDAVIGIAMRQDLPEKTKAPPKKKPTKKR